MTISGTIGWTLFVITALLQILGYLKIPDMILKHFESRLNNHAKSIEMDFNDSLEQKKERFDLEIKLRSLRMEVYSRLYGEMYIAYSSICSYSNRSLDDFYNFKNDNIKSGLLISKESRSVLYKIQGELADFVIFENELHSHPEGFVQKEVEEKENNYISKCNRLMDEVEKKMRKDLVIK